MEVGLIEKPPKEILRYLIIEHYHNVLNALEVYYKALSSSRGNMHDRMIKGRIKTFYYRVKQGLDKESQKTILEKIDSKPEKCIEGFYELTDILYKLGILNYLDAKTYDPSSAYQEDEAKGL